MGFLPHHVISLSPAQYCVLNIPHISLSCMKRLEFQAIQRKVKYWNVNRFLLKDVELKWMNSHVAWL